MSKKPKFEDTLPLEEVSSKPDFESTVSLDSPLKVKQEIPQGDLYDTLSDIAVTAPQGVTTWADEAQAALQAALKVGGGKKATLGEAYEQELAPIRERIGLATERSPIATGLGQVATGIGSAFVPGVGFGKLAGAGSMITRGAIEGLGTAEDKASMEGAVQSGMGAGIGALGSLASGALKKITTADPNKIRANILGARSSEFKEVGIKEREKIAKELKDMGLFSNTKVDFDVAQGKFISKGKSLENLEKPVREKLLDRLDQATGKIQTEKLKVIEPFKYEPIDLDELSNVLDDVSVRFSKKATGKKVRFEDAQELKNTILEDIADDMEEMGLEQPTIELIEMAKARLSDDVSNIGKNPSIVKTPYQADLYNQYYSGINRKLRSLFGDTKYSKYNDMQQKMLTAKTDLTKAIASEDAQKLQAGWGGWFNKLANETLGSPEAGLGTASTKETLDRVIPQGIQRGIKLGVEEAPFAGIRYIDPSIPEAKVPYSPGLQPTSMLTPKQMIKYRIPRSTDGILQNKETVLGKIAQAGVPDELYNTIAYALNESPEQIPNVVPLIISQFPNLFEQSKYKTFDNKFIDPNDKARAADDISKRDDLNSIQRAKMISKINKNSEVPEGLV